MKPTDYPSDPSVRDDTAPVGPSAPHSNPAVGPPGVLPSNSPRSREEGPDVRGPDDHAARSEQIRVESEGALEVETILPAKPKRSRTKKAVDAVKAAATPRGKKGKE